MPKHASKEVTMTRPYLNIEATGWDDGFVIPANAGTHAFAEHVFAEHAFVEHAFVKDFKRLDPGVRRDDDRKHLSAYVEVGSLKTMQKTSERRASRSA